jgi:hypothetical protein
LMTISLIFLAQSCQGRKNLAGSPLEPLCRRLLG